MNTREYSQKIHQFVAQFVKKIDVPEELAEGFARECGMKKAENWPGNNRILKNPSSHDYVTVRHVKMAWFTEVSTEGVKFTPYVSASGTLPHEWQKKIFDHYQVQEFFAPFPEGQKAVYMPVPSWVSAVSDDWADAVGQWMFEDEAVEAAEAFRQTLLQLLSQQGMLVVSAADLRLALEAAKAIGHGDFTSDLEMEDWGLTDESQAALAKVQDLLKAAEEAAKE